LGSGIRELKTKDDTEEFMVLGYKNGSRIDLHTEIHGYDVLEMVADGNLPKDDAQVSEDDGDLSEDSDPEYVNFHTEGEQNVVLEKLTIDDYFLTKLVGKGDFIGKKDDHIPPLRGAYILEEDDTDNDEIDAKSDYKSLLVYCGRDASLGRCVGRMKKIKKTKADLEGQKDHKCTRKYNMGSLVTFRWIARHYANEIVMNLALTYKFIREDIREKYMIDVSEGRCKRAKQCALHEHEGGLIKHYGKLWEYRQAILDSNPGSTCHMDVKVLDNGMNTFI
nr:chloramphenicol acetyltransferase-like domain-containing protein [Tanacetum cinerariifolium]